MKVREIVPFAAMIACGLALVAASPVVGQKTFEWVWSWCDALWARPTTSPDGQTYGWAISPAGVTGVLVGLIVMLDGLMLVVFAVGAMNEAANRRGGGA